MTSLLRVNNVSPQAGGTARNLPRGVAAAWVAFNGTGTVAITASNNVSSLTDGGVGAYVPNYTSAMASAAYNVSLTLQNTGAGSAIAAVLFGAPGGKAATGVAMQCVSLSATLVDNTDVNANVKGDLA